MKSPLLLVTLGALSLSSGSAAVQLLSNGNFESGDFSDWTATTQAGSAGTLSIDTPGTTTPSSGFTTAANPGGGSFYAVTDQSEPGSYSLTQSFTISSVPTSVILSFEMFANNHADSPTVGTLDYTAGATQFTTVDILTGGAGPFDLGANVLQNIFEGSDAGALPNPYTPYSIDITAAVSTPGTYQIRFAQADNLGNFNMGVDNVSILAVPEPGSSLLLLGSTMLLFRRRR